MTPRTQALVIGAGFGRSLALRFAREGYPTTLLARSGDHLDALAAEVRAFRTPVVTATTDAAEPLRLADTVRRLSEGLPNLEAQKGSVLFTGGGLALHPNADAGVLLVGKAAIRAAALVLAADLAARGLSVHTITIAGLIGPCTAFDPDRIADSFWELYTDPTAEPELIYTGEKRAQ
jgi:short-subunit dehydrogenase involved in D-alanine esterification of teichoic acids